MTMLIKTTLLKPDSKYKKGKTARRILKLISSCKFDLWKVSQMCVTADTQIRRYPDHANVFTRKISENNPMARGKRVSFEVSET